jgi:predicted DNA-binding ribbon-helix-helix protein
MTNDDELNAFKSTLVSRNVTVLGRRTSVRLEPEMWNSLREIARREDCKTHDICSLIHLRKNDNTSLTAAIRVFIMLYFRAASTENGHERAGHGNFKHMIDRARMDNELVEALKFKRNNEDESDEALSQSVKKSKHLIA